MPSEPSKLAAALARVQKNLPHVAKGEKANVGQYSYEYADLTAVTKEIMPLLGEHGLAFTAWPTLDDGRFVLSYSLIHESGEERTGVYPLPEKGTPQQLGGHITYARRYALCAVTGVAPGGDDNDGAGKEEVRMDRVRLADEDPRYRRAVRAAEQERPHTAGSREPGAWDGEDLWADQPAGEFNGGKQEQRPRRGSRTLSPAQAIAVHLKRLGVTDDTERLIKTSILAGRTEPIEHTADLDEAVQRQVMDDLAKLRNRAALDTLLDAKRAEVPS